MKAWFLKANDQLWERGIELVTGPHAHMELQFSDGLFFSSTQDLGPRFTTHDKLFDTNDEAWDIIDIPAVVPDEATVRDLAEMIIRGLTGINPTYSMHGILTDFLPIPLTKSSPNEWICSQSCVYVLQSIGLYMGYVAQQISPHAGYEILIREISTWQPLRFQKTEGV